MKDNQRPNHLNNVNNRKNKKKQTKQMESKWERRRDGIQLEPMGFTADLE